MAKQKNIYSDWDFMTKEEQERLIRIYKNIQIEYLAKFRESKYRPLFIENEYTVFPYRLPKESEEEIKKIFNTYRVNIDFDKLAKEFEEEYGMTVDEYKNNVFERNFKMK